MAHDDVCPCKHLRLVCEGQCAECLTEEYGEEVAASLVARDGAARSYPHGDERDSSVWHESWLAELAEGKTP